MVSRSTGTPDPHVCRYSIVHHRTCSINTAKREIDSLALFHEWLDAKEIDLIQRVESGQLLLPAEIDALSEYLRRSKNGPRLVAGKTVPRIVAANTHSDRMSWTRDYLRWRAAPIIARSSDLKAINFRERLNEVVNQINALRKSGKQKQRSGLTEDQRNFLLAVCRPDDSRNPFKPQTRFRNFAIILMLDELGLREGEPLVLKGVEDVKLHGSTPRIIIIPRPHDPDEIRRKPPLVKTAGRTLFLSKLLASVLNRYGVEFRSQQKGSKRQAYFFMGTKGDGAAMSLEAVYDIFKVLRTRFPDQLPPDLNPHKMRHTWNARFLKRATELGWEAPFRATVNNYLMGWAKNSKQSFRYGHDEIVRQAQIVLSDLQMQAETLA